MLSHLLLLTLSTLAAPAPAPSPLLHSALLPDTCSFTLRLRHHHHHSSPVYIQLNTIQDHANNLTIDVASQRPRAAFNSYTRLDRDRAFAVAGLLDGQRLTITRQGDGELGFEVGEVRWSARWADGEGGGAGEFGKAWCEGWEGEGGAGREVCETD